MIKIVMSVLVFFMATACWAAEDRFRLHFELTQNGNRISSGTLITSSKVKSWSNGLQKSYLQLQCKEVNGNIVKSYSTVDHFSGLVITHQYLEKKLTIDLIHTNVVPKFLEIRKLKLKECRELAPIVTRLHSKFEVEAEDVKGTEKSLGEGYLLRYTLTKLKF